MDDQTDGAEGESPDPVPGKPSLLERLLSPTAAPTGATAPAGGPGADGKTTKWAVDRLDGRERLYGYLAGIIAVAFAVLVYVVETNDKHLKLNKNQFTPQTTLIVGLVCGILLVVTTRIGRRALVGFVALFTFLGFQSTDVLLSVPFLILAVWLLYRSYKVQKEATARIKAERAEAGTGTASESGSGRAARTARPSAASARSAAETRAARKKGPPGPEGNKRYTPKKPAPRPVPAPKPSWRERRAAKASD